MAVSKTTFFLTLIQTVNGTFNQPIEGFTASVCKNYEDSRKLVLTMSPSSNESGDFDFSFVIPDDWELGTYTIVLENGLQFMDWKFTVRQNHGGGTLDRTVYPVPWSISPLKQFKSGIAIDDIQCKKNMILLKKHDDSPACVKPDSVIDLIKRNWLITEEINGYAIDYDSDVKHLPFADICTNEMKIILLTYSNLASPDEQFVMEYVALPSIMNQEDFQRCADGTSFTKSRWNMR
ncbi:MAG: hypothetical protein ACE5RC_04120 [Nitrosopumilus sp.]